MRRSVAAFRIAGLLATMLVAGACDGNLIRLGDGPVDGARACSTAPTSAAAVAWLGDSWVLVPGNQHTGVRDLARMAHAIGPNDDYTIDAAAAATMAGILGQYTTREASATKPQVLIMDGGTWDTLIANGSAASVTSVVNTFGQFLGTVASDGTVQQIIYFLPPELATIPGVSALRAPLNQACAASKVPCYFLDLQPIWAGHAEYTAPGTDSILPSTAGGAAIAKAIWDIMQAHCIAQ